ncbi:general transcription factor II-I repeat domain-containing protein [Dermatophagoides farinae]|uniref:General transcription factor II-I repeat domain-containing protein n=1 Tax=Dermatophagoides farinae TaxID=6954 RepID=A0A922HZZ2_DERFA|nr:general transcription factor II-I repeat domain-containing protein [Dermatophagoides farinae]
MSKSSLKKRKVDVENRTFNDKWTEDYYFIMGREMVLFVCYATNPYQHFLTKHPEKQSIDSEARKIEINALIENYNQTAMNEKTMKSSIIRAK